MRKKGQIVICDRCGSITFRELLATEDLDGGYTQNDIFEKIEDGWSYQSVPMGHEKTSCVDLCPKCTTEYEKTVNQYMVEPLVARDILESR